MGPVIRTFLIPRLSVTIAVSSSQVLNSVGFALPELVFCGPDSVLGRIDSPNSEPEITLSECATELGVALTLVGNGIETDVDAVGPI